METTKARRVVRSINDKLKNEMMEEEDEDDDDESFGEGSRKKKVPGKRGSGSGGSGLQPCCQVEDCTTDLTNCKTYHRRHKVCEVHSKAPIVITGGRQQRFCQQCSRFHDLTEFDDTKRSCRRRLAGHNERRRKSSYGTYGESS